MKTENANQPTLFEKATPAEKWGEDETKHTLDELFNNARKYRFGQSYMDLMAFISRFRFYSPYNAMLLHIQMPGACYVAPAARWARQYGRAVKPEARPLVILQPMGPVMFVFDVSDTEPGPHAQPLPTEIEKPFDIQRGTIGHEYEQTIENAKRDGIRVTLHEEGSQSAGSISCVDNVNKLSLLQFRVGRDVHGDSVNIDVPVRYDLLMNKNLSRTSNYATMVHELAHLYCGHLGTPNRKWWPDRQGLQGKVREFEAESIAFMICNRLNISNPSDAYLAHYLKHNQEIPQISIECVIKTAGLIEQMGQKQLKPRKDKE
ncbi:MAG TPA: hypothetical protein PLX02_04010 [Syntrophorhabdaceae bacterium]|nr:hypothetical protein [Syntrophorhabdaceae bacterium]HQM80765.1 hypothetical protein [Syntrophorhabdaceae bacterium]